SEIQMIVILREIDGVVLRRRQSQQLSEGLLWNNRSRLVPFLRTSSAQLQLTGGKCQPVSVRSDHSDPTACNKQQRAIESVARLLLSYGIYRSLNKLIEKIRRHLEAFLIQPWDGREMLLSLTDHPELRSSTRNLYPVIVFLENLDF